MVERRNQENKVKNEESIKEMEKLRTENENLKYQLEVEKEKMSNLEHELEGLFEKNKYLEEMKEKSTVTLFEKYNKSMEYIEELQKDNGRLKNEIESLRKSFELKFQYTEQNYQS